MSAQNLGLGAWPVRRARLTPDAVAWSFEGVDTTFAEVDDRVARLATALRRAGIGRGDRVAYIGGNHPALLETLFAAGSLGAVAVLINSRLARNEVSCILADSGATALFFGGEVRALVAEVAASGETPRLQALIAVDGLGDAEAPLPSGALDYAELAATEPERVHVPVSLDDPCLIMYTSGTTGRPKGAVLTHGNIFFNDINVLIETDIRPDEVCLAAAPLYHIAGLNGLVLPVFLKGGRLVIQRVFRPEAVLAALESEAITCSFSVPAMLDALAHQPGFGETDLGALRTLIVGGAPVPTRILRHWTERGVDIQQGYGLTETSPAVLKLAAEDAERKVGSAGKPQFLVDVRVVDLNGNDIAVGGSGEIITRGPNVFAEYWNRPDDSAAAFSDGWFRTGDIATVDEDGYVFLRDRSKDMFISGGENVYPSEVENALLDVAGIAETAVIGIPDAKWGEVGKAFVVAEAGAELSPETILAGLKSRLARYKLPRAIEVVPQLPRTSTGKLRKHVLRALEQERNQDPGGTTA